MNGKNGAKVKTQAVQAKRMFVLKIAVPKFAQFRVKGKSKKGRKQLTFSLFFMFVSIEVWGSDKDQEKLFAKVKTKNK